MWVVLDLLDPWVIGTFFDEFISQFCFAKLNILILFSFSCDCFLLFSFGFIDFLFICLFCFCFLSFPLILDVLWNKINVRKRNAIYKKQEKHTDGVGARHIHPPHHVFFFAFLFASPPPLCFFFYLFLRSVGSGERGKGGREGERRSNF